MCHGKVKEKPQLGKIMDINKINEQDQNSNYIKKTKKQRQYSNITDLALCQTKTNTN